MLVRENADNCILVTGGAGFIGSHTCKHLASKGIVPVAYDDLSTGHASAVRWGPLVIGDIADTTKVAEVLGEYRISTVIHFAASAYVGESTLNPRKYFNNNLVKTISFLDSLLDGNVKQIVFSSTCATYGKPNYVPIDEAHPQVPVNPYGDTKLAIEKVLRWYGNSYGLRWIALRYFNAAGADPEGEIGECHQEESHLIPLALQSLLPGREPLRIFGSDYPTEDGTAVRDYVHVSDLAKAHALAVDYLKDGSASRAFNLGSGNGHSIKQVLAAIAQATKRHVKTIQCDRREGDPATLIADASAVKQELGWQPELSELKEIVRTAWRWFESQEREEQFAAAVLTHAAQTG